MARFFKPLLSAVALAAAALTSTGALAAYAYNAQISVTAPKYSNAEAAAKDKTLPAGVKYTTCAARKSGAPNWDQFTLTVKYDAGKLTSEIGDVYVVLQNLTNKITGGTGQAASRYVFLNRDVSVLGLDAGAGSGVTVALQDGGALAGLSNDPNNIAPTGTPWPYLRANDNLGLGAQTEVLFGGPLAMEALPQGLWTASVIIAKPGAKMTAFSVGAPTATEYESSFSLARPETWAASDTVAFVVGTPLDDVTTATPVAPSSDCL